MRGNTKLFHIYTPNHSQFNKLVSTTRPKTNYVTKQYFSFKCTKEKTNNTQETKSKHIHSNLLENRVCFISNCEYSKSIDLPTQVAKSLALYGASVIVHGRDKNYVKDLEYNLSLNDTIAQKHHSIVFNLEQMENFEILRKEISNFTNKIDVLVHNAGTISKPKALHSTEIELTEFDKLVRYNLTTPFALVKYLLPLLENGNNPSIILSSTEVLDDNENNHYNQNTEMSYYISKFGFRSSGMLTKMLANELEGKNIRVNSIDPGRVFQFKVPEVIPEGSDRTVAYIWLARSDTFITSTQLDVKDWIKRDPKLYNYYY